MVIHISIVAPSSYYCFEVHNLFAFNPFAQDFCYFLLFLIFPIFIYEMDTKSQQWLGLRYVNMVWQLHIFVVSYNKVYGTMQVWSNNKQVQTLYFQHYYYPPHYSWYSIWPNILYNDIWLHSDVMCSFGIDMCESILKGMLLELCHLAEENVYNYFLKIPSIFILSQRYLLWLSLSSLVFSYFFITVIGILENCSHYKYYHPNTSVVY